MSITTLARPYARAVFEIAVQAKQLPQWQPWLEYLAQLVETAPVKQLLHSPEFSPQQQASALLAIAKTKNVQQKHFIELLATRRRLAVLPEIAILFNEFKTQLEQTVQVTVTSPLPLEEKFITELTQKLTQRLQKNIDVTTAQDPTLIGGFLVRAGDTVIDASVRGQLNRLHQQLVD